MSGVVAYRVGQQAANAVRSCAGVLQALLEKKAAPMGGDACHPGEVSKLPLGRESTPPKVGKQRLGSGSGKALSRGVSPIES